MSQGLGPLSSVQESPPDLFHQECTGGKSILEVLIALAHRYDPGEEEQGQEQEQEIPSPEMEFIRLTLN